MGTVKEITERPKDFEVGVQFDEAGYKKMFAGFAKLKKI
jgi:DNA helicase-2/ATP-dependent DNA helicase PcrA